mmetsp:Transcript_16805/g.42179  ORF Transcript_16805/g.42179 Transcript_16805/m.42179 type:complete len:95 (+) Transcript_16805:373-657(+)|eukprot:CAMPEP_0113879502 /NCGR_PEP_ID=MMETSP0780_2-20120614/7273_1 /TAXON_ID=652834 /ORGANISM="Palpitomonas bilix" /LENGTH=94 /DNA_ID=CAMNT_0000866089 /DNA_START=485 /DNA_END=769 /DNA_ORIENTATION=+ /assembly_acc=CAM_ASM_000599
MAEGDDRRRAISGMPEKMVKIEDDDMLQKRHSWDPSKSSLKELQAFNFFRSFKSFFADVFKGYAFSSSVSEVNTDRREKRRMQQRKALFTQKKT